MSFSALGLSQALVNAVHAAGYTEPTPVQQQAIPAALQDKDLMVAAQTGTGKTASFALPILQKLYAQPDSKRIPLKGKQVRVLVLTPTRELAAQVHESFNLYARELPLTSACVYGGVGAAQQIRTLSKGIDVLVACPGRLLDLIGQNAVDLAEVDTLVLDEADRMLDMGFIHDVKKILKLLPQQRQNLLYSATFSNDIIALTNRLLHNPLRIEVTPRNTTVERIKQSFFRITAPYKRALLAHLITAGAWEQVLVFTRTKHGANRLAEYLTKNGLPAAAIHGNKSQNARTKALEEFKGNQVRVLVATDIAARGLDIDELPYVVNYELPTIGEDYVHRIGRTGRAGRAGEAISLVAPSELRLLKSIEQMTQQELPEGDYLGFDLSSVVAEISRSSANQADKPRQQPSKTRNPRNSRGRSNEEQTGAEKPAARTARTSQRQAKPEGKDATRPNPARRANPKRAAEPKLPADRAPDVFLDDAIDNFGNRVDYVSPYQNKDGNRTRQGANQTRAANPGAARNTRSQAPKRGGKPNTGRNQPRGRRQQDSALFVSADPTPAYVAVERERERAATNTPLIIRKGERLPSLEQLDQLDARSNSKRERPALLSKS